jgi:hypothetical protein
MSPDTLPATIFAGAPRAELDHPPAQHGSDHNGAADQDRQQLWRNEHQDDEGRKGSYDSATHHLDEAWDVQSRALS